MIRLLALIVTFWIASAPALAADCSCPSENGADQRFRTFAALTDAIERDPAGTYRLLGDCVAGEYEDRITEQARMWQEQKFPPSNYVAGSPSEAGVYNGDVAKRLNDAQQEFLQDIAAIRRISGILDGAGHTLFGNGRHALIVGNLAAGEIKNLHFDPTSRAECAKPTS